MIVVVGLRSWCSTVSSNGDNDCAKDDELDVEFDDVLSEKPELQLQGVDPRKGWGFRGVHKVIDVKCSMTGSVINFAVEY